MALPVDGSADSDLSAKGLTAEELIIVPSREELQEDSDGKIDDENEGVYSVQLGEEILQVGHMQKRRAQSQVEVTAESGVLPPALAAVV